MGSQGISLPSVSTGSTTDPGKGVGDGSTVAVAVGSGVFVGSGVKVAGREVNVGGMGVEAGAHPLIATISKADTRTSSVEVFMVLSFFDLE